MINLKKLSLEELRALSKIITREIECRKINKNDLEKFNEINKVYSSKEAFSQYRSEFAVRNGSRLLSLRNTGRGNKDPFNKIEYLPALMLQDWSYLFSDTPSSENKFYVYAHIDPTDRILCLKKEFGGVWGGSPFYIGKGCGDRAYDLKRNQGHGLKIRQIMALGFGSEDIVKIVFENLSEAKALEIESKLIYFFGTQYDKSRAGGILLNLDMPKVPQFEGEMERYITINQQIRNDGKPSDNGDNNGHRK